SLVERTALSCLTQLLTLRSKFLMQRLCAPVETLTDLLHFSFLIVSKCNPTEHSAAHPAKFTAAAAPAFSFTTTATFATSVAFSASHFLLVLGCAGCLRESNRCS